ncbi:MAG: helix-turn-helix domain-containing protein [Betaproteobacteria bacterium]|nr:helix-turn-helix domain-containing protein [Betaproteobacteria bacterium]
MEKVVMTKEEVAKLLCVSKRKIERMVKAKTFIKPAKIGDLPRWRVVDVLNWIENSLKPGAQL